jgi:hypothetical protein
MEPIGITLMPVPKWRTVFMVQSGSSKAPPLRNASNETNNPSPAPGTPDPFHLISTNPVDIAAMQKAENNPHLIMLSDWDHLTAAEYQQVQENSGLEIL